MTQSLSKWWRHHEIEGKYKLIAFGVPDLWSYDGAHTMTSGISYPAQVSWLLLANMTFGLNERSDSHTLYV